MGKRYVNADASRGSLTAELLSEDGQILLGREGCRPVTADGAKQPLFWETGRLSDYRGQRIRLRFYLDRARLYAFWISPKESGASMGYLAAGGPEACRGTDR